MSETETDVNHSNDVSWLTFLLVAAAMSLTAWLVDEKFRPMRNVDPTEKIVWYASYGSSFLLLPGLVILLVHLVSKRNGAGLRAPKKVIIVVGVGLLVFTQAMVALRGLLQ